MPLILKNDLDAGEMYLTAEQAVEEFARTDHLNARPEMRHLPLKEHAKAFLTYEAFVTGTLELDEAAMVRIICFLTTPR